jgi:hypothetical protein
MSWSYRIVILYIGFMSIILTLVFTCFGEKIELESKDYYAKELRFQAQIDAEQNAKELPVPIRHEVRGRTVELQIPAALLGGGLEGEVHFFRPSDSSLDRVLVLSPDSNGICVLRDENLLKGFYRMQITLKSNGTRYYKQEVINFK